MASIAAPVVAIVELLGGLALIAGLVTRVAAVALAIVMLGAITMVHWSAGYFLPNGFEFALLLLVLNAALAIAGGGEYSVDALLARRGAPSGAPTAPQVQRAA
jgi:putative oxidoreductase